MLLQSKKIEIIDDDNEEQIQYEYYGNMMNNKNGNYEANQKDEEHADEMLLGYSEKRRLRQTRGE